MKDQHSHRRGVLQGALAHGQPRRLQRPERAGSPSPEASSRAKPPGTAVPPADLEAARQDAFQQGLRDAQAHVDAAIARARAEAEQAAFERVERLRAEQAGQRASMDRIARSLEQSIDARLSALDEEAIALAFEAVCRVLGEASATPDGVAALVRQALSQVRHGPVLRVRLHPADLRCLLEGESGRRLKLDTPHVDWRADDAVQGGGCLVDTATGTLDARLRTQLESLAALWSGRDEDGVA